MLHNLRHRPGKENLSLRQQRREMDRSRGGNVSDVYAVGPTIGFFLFMLLIGIAMLLVDCSR